MKKYLKILLAVLALSIASVPVHEARAQAGIMAVIQQGIKRVIRAVDLKIQRLQNKTIWLQNAQKTLENALSKLKLKEIAEWTEKQKEQYRKYYEELAKVKAMITYYQRIREVAQKQVAMVNEYSRAWALIRSDRNFTAEELSYMEKVYGGILEATIDNIDQITLIIESFALHMGDAKRLQLINDAADKIDTTYDDLRRFNRQNMVLSLQRAKTAQEIAAVKKLYGLP
ncbi:conjugal transfer protein TraI [Flavobacterium lindanitolerans]|uniref:conjugal transfer protein TraI n=1 Tax=Flavobacterium lindanitolerans TaxID=428988 RepID=UPI0027B98925|nr:conjugal transfer protein TraI [Flavobacterium lindanitolerans]